MLVVTAVLQIKYLNKALQRFDSTAVIPTQFVLFTVSAIIGSAVIYHDFDNMTLDQMSRFMSGCAVEFLGVYLITSKRPKSISSPALSISADSGTAVSYSDEEALDRVDLLPNGRQVNTNNRKRNSTRIALGTNTFTRSSQPIGSPLFETWQENGNALSHVGATHIGHRRQSSVFRGISMASQLLDRDDEQQSQQPIQLPISSPPNTSSHNKKRDSALGNLLNGITSAITSHTHSNDAVLLNDADAVEIEIPTPSSFHNPDNMLDRELMPMNNNKRGSKLVDISETSSEEYRDLS